MKGKYTYRFKYEKNHGARYISHLDFVRLMGRALRRATLPISYSEGFNPHPVMTVAAPLSVGVTSGCEYMDIGFSEIVNCGEAVKRLNIALPGGIVMLAAKLLTPGDVSFNKITSAKYTAVMEMNSGIPDTGVFLSLPSIEVLKKSKKAERQTDIKPDIRALALTRSEGRFAELEIETSAGNTRNLKPELVIAAMEQYLPDFSVEFAQIHRLALLADGRELI